MTKEELKQELIDTEESTREEVDKMSGYDLPGAILTREGICGYTRKITRRAQAAYEPGK